VLTPSEKDGECAVRCKSNREIVAVISGLAVGKIFGVIFGDGGVLIVLTSDVSELS